MYKNIIYCIAVFGLFGCGGGNNVDYDVDYDVDNSEKPTSYFVSPFGDDTNDGTEVSPFKSIQKAADTAKAGETVFIKEGTYKERVELTNTGTKDKKIVFQNYARDIVIVDGSDINWSESGGGLFDLSEVSYIVLSGIEVRNSTHAGIYVDASHHITIKNSKTHNTYSSGIGVWSSSHIKVENNEISLACNDGGEECISIVESDYVDVTHNEVYNGGPGTNGGEGIDVKEGSKHVKVKYNHVHDIPGVDRPALYADAWDKNTSDIIFESNRVHDIKANAIAVASEMGGVLKRVNFVNNIIYNIESEGFIVGGWTADGETVASNPVEHISIINNTFYNISGDGIYVGNVDAKNIKIYNNIIQSKQNQLPISIEFTPVREVDIRHNLIDTEYENYGQIGDSIGNPLFVDASHEDFHLQSNSPAINTGIENNLSILDYDKNSRKKDGQWDIGAYESTLE